MLMKNGARMLDMAGLVREMEGPSRPLVEEMVIQPGFPYKMIRSKRFYLEYMVVDWLEDHMEYMKVI